MALQREKLKQFAVVATSCFFLDQATKQLVLAYIDVGQHYELIGDRFTLTLSYNKGVAFSLFANQGLAVTVLLALCVLVGIVFLMLALQNQLPNLYWVGAIIGGALGNLLDRCVHQGVVDFLDLWFWPTFNVADVAIVLGTLGMVYQLIGREEQTG